MRAPALTALALFALLPSPSRAYVEAPHSLGQCVHMSTTVVVMELARVNKDKNLLIFKKVRDLKGKHPQDEIKHNIGKRGFNPREWQTVMAWAEVGKKAIFMYNNEASETCLGTYWYQCYREGEWWGMSHAEPFLLRTFYGDVDKLESAVERILKGQEVVVTCLADGDKKQLHLRKGKLQRMKASLKRLNYDAKRDFAGLGGDGDEVDEFKTVQLVAESTPGWRILPAKQIGNGGDRWFRPEFDDGRWRVGKAPIGYGEPEIKKRQGTEIAEKGQDFVFRRWVEVPAELLAARGVKFQLRVASDDSARVYLNGSLVDQDPADDHEFAYWNRDVEIPVKHFKPGRNLIAVYVKNKPASSDLYLDLELAAQVPIPKPPKKQPNPAVVSKPKGPASPVRPLVIDEPRDPNALKVDRKARTVTIACQIAPRKLPNLDQKYPIEVIATYAAPRGQKAHETVVIFKGVRPSDVHKALTELGLKPGKPAYGENAKAQGPEVKVYLEFTGADGKLHRLPFEKLLVHRDGRPMTPLKWYFTGSAMKQPDPEKDLTVYGADTTGTLLSIFPVTDCTVLQSQLTMKDEPQYKLETDGRILPKEGTAAKLIIAVE